MMHNELANRKNKVTEMDHPQNYSFDISGTIANFRLFFIL